MKIAELAGRTYGRGDLAPVWFVGGAGRALGAHGLNHLPAIQAEIARTAEIEQAGARLLVAGRSTLGLALALAGAVAFARVSIWPSSVLVAVVLAGPDAVRVVVLREWIRRAGIG